jgi:hypothetical protein
MTIAGLNSTDPTTDGESPRIGPVDGSLPAPPDHEDVVDESDQPEPENTEVPDAVLD